MSTVEKELTEFKIELSREWRMLQTHKWRRPKWIKFPRSMVEDSRWLSLSNSAKATWMSILMIAAESPNYELPETQVLFRRLRSLGNVWQPSKFLRIIDELNQCGFIVKTTPELQSYRATELQSKKVREEDKGLTINPVDSAENSEKRLSEKEGIETVPSSPTPLNLEDERKIIALRWERLNNLSARLAVFKPKSNDRSAPLAQEAG